MTSAVTAVKKWIWTMAHSVHVVLPKTLWQPPSTTIYSDPTAKGATMARKPKADYTLRNHGSIIMVWPLTNACREWLFDHTDGQWMGGGECAALAVEPRYVGDLCTGLSDAGFYQGR